MTSTLTSPSPAARRAASRDTSVSKRRRPTRIQRQRAGRDQRLLGSYTDQQGHAREVIARGGAAGSTLVVDRDRDTHGDARLVAHLAGDEPCENAALICERYLEDPVATRRRCRLLTAEDARITPFAEPADGDVDRSQGEAVSRSTGDGCRYGLEPSTAACRSPSCAGVGIPADGRRRGRAVSVREAVAAWRATSRYARSRSARCGRTAATPRSRRPCCAPSSRGCGRARSCSTGGLREVVLATVDAPGAEHERDRDPLRARQARPPWQRERRDELAGAPSRAAAGGRARARPPLDPQRRAGADRAPRAGSEPARGRSSDAQPSSARADRSSSSSPIRSSVSAIAEQLLADGFERRAGAQRRARPDAGARRSAPRLAVLG